MLAVSKCENFLFMFASQNLVTFDHRKCVKLSVSQIRERGLNLKPKAEVLKAI